MSFAVTRIMAASQEGGGDTARNGQGPVRGRNLLPSYLWMFMTFSFNDTSVERSRGRNSSACHRFLRMLVCAAPADGLSSSMAAAIWSHLQPYSNFPPLRRVLQQSPPRNTIVGMAFDQAATGSMSTAHGGLRDRLCLRRAVSPIRRTAHGVVVEDSLGHSDTTIMS